MALTNRYGNALLALTTSRPPDTERGTGIVHLDVVLPDVVANEVERAEQGARAPLEPKQAAQLLWSAPAAAYVVGRPDAWRSLPGLGLLLPGHEALAKLKPEEWPVDRNALRAFVARAAGHSTVEAWSDEVERMRLLPVLNDLVLIFKYATLGRRRPLQEVAGLFRLAATCAATPGPTNRAEVVAWLNAPLVIPKVFTGPTTPPLTRPEPSDDHTRPRPWRFSFDSPAAKAALKRVESELALIEKGRQATAVSDALRAEGVTDPNVVARITRAVSTFGVGERLMPGNLGTPAVDLQPERIAVPPARAVRQRIVRTYIAGHPVLVDVDVIDQRAQRFRQAIAQDLTSALPSLLRDRLARAGVALETLSGWGDLVTAASQSPSYLEPIGRSDLLVVRQTTIGYRRAELAYVENILVGETRDRQHTQRIFTRREVFESTVREQEETRDLQTTDRSELSREVSDVVNEDLRAQGSVEVTSRGPTKVVASAAVSFARSTEEAAKSVEEYSRETVERAVKRTLDRVTREIRSVIEQETTEANRHTFTRDSNAADHVSGLYQYLERVSRARVFWYGERELYDLLIPEPAALIWHLSISRKELHNPLERPDAELFASLTLGNIAQKREEVIRAFRVTDMPDLPPDVRRISLPFYATGDGDGAKHAAGKELQVPDGYEVVKGTFTVSAEVEDSDDKPNGGWVAGTQVGTWIIQNLPNNQGEFREDIAFPAPLAGPTIGVAVNIDNFTSISGSIDLELQLTQKAREAWALQAFGRVVERYEQLRREYETTLIQLTQSFEREVTELPEGSRQRLQQVVRFELQRAAIDLMRNEPVDYDLIADHPYTASDGSLASHPVADVAALRAAEPEVRFLQQAFEWEHMSWIVYPYFWGRRSEWHRTVLQNHPDPDFSAFLNAGAARVQISVRPGFEHLVKHFMETREVYGGGLPRIGDPGYVSFIDEQMASLGAPGEEIQWPPDAPIEWDIVAPTSLVLARSLALPQLPTWNPEDGEET